MFAIHFIAFTVFYLKMDESTLFYFYGAQAIYLGAVLVLFRNLYPRASKLLVNNMCMLITIGFIMLTRISYDQSMKQFKILAIATVAALIIPILVKKLKFLDKLGYIYALGGIGLLGVVLVFAKFSYGSKLSLSIGGFTFQPSEFVKIIFVFAVASLLAKATDFKHVVITTAIAGAHVLILVVSKDLGSALIFFVTYLVMLYVGTRDWRYLFLGIAAGDYRFRGCLFPFQPCARPCSGLEGSFCFLHRRRLPGGPVPFRYRCGRLVWNGPLPGFSDDDSDCGAGFYVFCNL